MGNSKALFLAIISVAFGIGVAALLVLEGADLGLGAAAVALLFAVTTRSPGLLVSAIPIVLVAPFLHYTPLPMAPSMSFSDAALGVLVGIGLVLIPRQSGSKQVTTLTKAVVAFYALNFLSLLLSVNPTMTMRSLFQLTLALGLYFLCLRLQNTENAIPLLRSVAFITVAGSVLALAQFVTGDSLFMDAYLNEVQRSERVTFGEAAIKSVAFLGHGNSFALLVTICLPLVLGLYQRGKNSLVIAAILAIGIVGDLTTFSRGGLIAISITLVVFFLFWSKWQPRNWLFVALGGAFVVGMLFNDNDLFRTTIERFTSADYLLRDSGSNFSRLINLQAGINAFMSNPLSGIGAGTSGTYYVLYGGFTDLGPHNLYLLVASERGVFCALAFLYMIWVAIRTGYQTGIKHGDVIAAGALASVMGLLIHGLFESVLVDIFQYFAFMSLGLIGARAHLEAANLGATTSLDSGVEHAELSLAKS